MEYPPALPLLLNVRRDGSRTAFCELSIGGTQRANAMRPLLHLVRADVDVRPGEARLAALVGGEVIWQAGDGIVSGIDGGAGGSARATWHTRGSA